MAKSDRKQPQEETAPFQVAKSELEALMIDVRYALEQLTQHRDHKRAIDGLQRIQEVLKNIISR